MSVLVKTFKLTKATSVYIIIGVAVVLALLTLVLTKPAGEDMGTTEGRAAYLDALGWQVDPVSETRQVVVLPREFTGVFADYNAMQLRQGFDLREYAGMECVLYSYLVLNYPDAGSTVVAQIFVCGTRVIGGDIHSTALDGFMHTLK